MKKDISILRKINLIKLNEDQIFFALTIITGISAALIAVGIHYAVKYLSQTIGTNESFTWQSTILGGIFIYASAWLTFKFYPSTTGSGIPSVTVAMAVEQGRIPFMDWVAKGLTSILSLASGISLGREGPTVTIAAGFGSSLGQAFALSKQKIKTLCAVGSAGGIAAAFNTPIAGVVFTLEEVVGDLNASKLLGPIVISSVVASVTGLMLHGGSESTLSVLKYSFDDPATLIFYFAIGLACAILGPLWTKSVLKLRQINSKIFRHHKKTVVCVTFFILAAFSQLSPSVLGSGHETINQVLTSDYLSWELLLKLFLLKFLATSICYASGVSGGLFMPSLFIGAMLGGLIGSVATQFYDVGSVGSYALVGMGAFFVTVIRAPFTSIIMIFELTQDYKIILPPMVANMTAYLISSKFHKESIYESVSEQDGIHLPTREDDEVLETLHVEDAMITDIRTLNGNEKVKEVVNKVKQSISGYPVLINGKLIGPVSLNELKHSIAANEGEDFLKDICPKNIISIYPDQSLLVAFHIIKKFQVSRLPVVSRINERMLVGLITPEDIANHFGYHIQEEEESDQPQKAE